MRDQDNDGIPAPLKTGIVIGMIILMFFPHQCMQNQHRKQVLEKAHSALEKAYSSKNWDTVPLIIENIENAIGEPEGRDNGN